MKLALWRTVNTLSGAFAQRATGDETSREPTPRRTRTGVNSSSQLMSPHDMNNTMVQVCMVQSTEQHRL